MKNKIKILHSFPKNEEKFKYVIELTFISESIDNTVVNSLTKTKINIYDFDLLVLHYMKSDDIKFLITHKIEIPVIWFAWGMEVYARGKFQKKILLPKTRALFSLILFKESKLSWFKNIIKTSFPFIYDNSVKGRNMIKAINSTDYMVPVVPGDYYLLKKHYNIKPQLFHPNYVNRLFIKKEIPIINGNNILLGNSATPTNNHIEAIDQLKKCDLKDRKVIIPLSYGGYKLLAEKIAKYAHNQLGSDNVIILRDFLPFEEYNRLILSCNVVVMNHIRQQAVGNIKQALIQGAHVYLRRESTVYKYLKENQLHVGVINHEEVFDGLKDNEITENIAIMKKIFNPNEQRKNLNEFIKRAIFEKKNSRFKSPI